MKAAVLVRQNAPLEIMDIEIPPLGVGQVLVKMAYSGICGKQIDEIKGRRPDPFIPHLLGHEGTGEVVEVGAGVRKVQKGDIVVLHWMKGSGIDSDPPRFGKVSAGWVTTFSEYTIASENRVTKLPDRILMGVASLLGCAVTTGLGIVFNNANLKPGQSIAVYGCGGVGLNVIQAAKMVNAFPITGVDRYTKHLDWAKAFGADYIDTKINSIYIKDYDVTVDTTGNPEVREAAYKATKSLCILAGVPGESDRMTIDSYDLHSGKRIIGSHGGNTNPDVDIPRYIGLYKRGILKLDEQITHRFPLEKINEAIATVANGEAGRCLIWM